MHKLLLPLCALGILLLANPSQAFFDDVEQMHKQLQGQTTSPSGADAGAAIDELMRAVDAVPVTFTDIPADSWYETYVTALSQRGIVSGFRDAQGNPTGKFGPGYLVTIAEVLKMAFRAAGVDETKCTGTLRHPHAAAHWARSFVLCGEQRSMRILKNFPNLDRAALRGEVLAMIDDAFGAAIPSLHASFKDTKNHSYEKDIAYAASRGVVSGDTDPSGIPTNTFRPDDRINRAEVAKMVYVQLQTTNANGATEGISENGTTIGWKTYTDGRYGFSLRYPPAWSTELVTSSWNNMGDYVLVFDRKIFGFFPSLSVREQWSLDDERAVLVATGAASEKIHVENFQIATLQGRKVTFPSYEGGNLTHILIFHGNNTLIFSIDDNDHSEFEKIIASLLFLYPTVSGTSSAHHSSMPGASRSSSRSSFVPFSSSSASTAATPQPVTLDIVVTNFSFTPNSIHVKANQLVTFRFNVAGTHTFTVDGVGINIPLADGVTSATFALTEKGTYAFYCAMAGHRELGMEGTLVVE